MVCRTVDTFLFSSFLKSTAQRRGSEAPGNIQVDSVRELETSCNQLLCNQLLNRKPSVARRTKKTSSRTMHEKRRPATNTRLAVCTLRESMKRPQASQRNGRLRHQGDETMSTPHLPDNCFFVTLLRCGAHTFAPSYLPTFRLYITRVLTALLQQGHA